MGSVEVGDHRRSSLWNMITCEPLYIIIPNLLIVRPSRLLFNYYIKPAKFLMIVLPRNIWRQGNICARASVGCDDQLMDGTYVARASVHLAGVDAFECH